MFLNKKPVIAIIFTIFVTSVLYQNPRKICVVFDIGGKNDNSFNESAYQGLVDVARYFEGRMVDPADDIYFGDNVELAHFTIKENKHIEDLSSIAANGYELIFANSFIFSQSIPFVARKFPDTYFVIIDGLVPDLKKKHNITCVTFNESEGSFLVGAIAGLKSDTHKIGFLGGMESPLIQRFEIGFRAGVKFVNKKHGLSNRVFTEYLGKNLKAFDSPAKAYVISKNLYSRGIDIIFHASGGSGAGLFQAAEEYQKYAIGVDSDQGLNLAKRPDVKSREQAKFVLTSMIKKVNKAILLIARDFLKLNKLEGGYRNFGLEYNAVSYAVNPYNQDNLFDVREEIDKIYHGMINKVIKVPGTFEELETMAE